MVIKQIYQLADGAGAVLLPTNDIIKLTHQARGEQGWVNQLLILVLSAKGCLKDLVWECNLERSLNWGFNWLGHGTSL